MVEKSSAREHGGEQSENTVGRRGDLETRDEIKVSKEQNHVIWRSGTLRLPLATAKWSDAGQQVLAALTLG